MKRPLSHFALSAWAGFCASHAFLLACAAGGADPSALVQSSLGLSMALPEAPSLPPLDAAAGATFLLGATGALAAALLRLSDRRLAGRQGGERIAASALTGVAVLFGAAALAGSPLGALVGAGSSFALVLAVTFGVLLFDHAVDDEDAEADALVRLASRLDRAAPADGRARRRGEGGRSDIR